MSRFRRYYIPDAIYFITGVANKRMQYFSEEKNILLFWTNLRKTKAKFRFRLLAYVLLWDHFHLLIKPEGCTISDIMGSFKKRVTQEYKRNTGITSHFVFWQRRFWDHVIRNEVDLKFHLDYIHYNPIKHGYTKYPENWKETSFHLWVEKGEYEIGWGYSHIKEIMDAELE